MDHVPSQLQFDDDGMIRAYFSLIKPRIILGNLITAAAGFAWASKGHFDLALFFLLLLGLSFVIGSAAAINNWVDKEIDAKMERTKKRPLVTGKILPKHAFFFASFLGFFGFLILALFTNKIATLFALCGHLVYIAMYTPLKHRMSHATLVGSIAGAMPPIVGYTAVSGTMNLEALSLFLLLALWQMPHFYSLALYRCEEYRAASIPVLPVIRGNATTKLHTFSYVILFGGVSFLPSFLGNTGTLYWVVALSVSALWLYLSSKGFWTKDDAKWGKMMFRFSLVAILSLMLALSVGGR